MPSRSAQKCYWTHQLRRSPRGQHWRGSRHFQSPVLTALGVHNQNPQNLPILLGVPQAAADQSPRKTRRLQLKTLSGKFNPRDSLRLTLSPLWSELVEHPAAQPRSCFPPGPRAGESKPSFSPGSYTRIYPCGQGQGRGKRSGWCIPGSHPALSWEHTQT